MREGIVVYDDWERGITHDGEDGGDIDITN